MDAPNLSILQNIANAEIYRTPYPHLVIRNALPADLYAELEATYPSPEIVLDGREAKDTWFDYPACKVVKDSRLTEKWRNFFAYHSGPEFYRDLLRDCGSLLRELHPQIEAQAGKGLEEFKVAMRPGGKENPLAEGADLSMECQFYINYTRTSRIVRGPHVDRPSELFAALLYFRREDDDSTGGDLDIIEAKDSSIYRDTRSVHIDQLPMEIQEDKVEITRTARYEANTLVLFLNSARSIHAVSPRSATPIPRRHINFCGDLRFDLFELDFPHRLRIKQTLQKMPVLWRAANLIKD